MTLSNEANKYSTYGFAARLPSGLFFTPQESLGTRVAVGVATVMGL